MLLEGVTSKFLWRKCRAAWQLLSDQDVTYACCRISQEHVHFRFPTLKASNLSEVFDMSDPESPQLAICYTGTRLSSIFPAYPSLAVKPRVKDGELPPGAVTIREDLGTAKGLGIHRSFQALEEFLRQKDVCDQYRTSHAVTYADPWTHGYTSINVLEFLYGLPLTNLALAYVHALRPSFIRISNGQTTTDSLLGRVTILVDEHDVVLSISQEVAIAYGCGADIHLCLQRQQEALSAQAKTAPSVG